MSPLARGLAVFGTAVALLLALGYWLLRPRLDPDVRPVEVAVADERSGFGDTLAAEPPGTRAADLDREIFRERMEWAREERLDTLPIGEVIAQLGRTFVGTRYVPHTLEQPGAERLVINLHELDCVTYVENVLAMSRLIRDGGGTEDFEAFTDELRRIRYRQGRLAGYPSRLHYFSEWIQDNQDKGVVRDLTTELGGVEDSSPLNFMTRHAEAYRQLSDPAVLEAIGAIEVRLGRRARHRIPQERIAEVAPAIRNGDVIAATSTLEGLDVAHTGLALWVDGRLHLMHAPLVGSVVEISEKPLAERIQGIRQQDGIMVARPL